MRDDNIFHPDFDLGDFRWAVARWIKLLIRARWIREPGFLPDKELQNWGLSDIRDDKLPEWRLLEDAAIAHGRLNAEFLPLCGSGGIRETDENTAEGRLIFEVAFLIYPEGGGPEHNLSLRKAAESLKKGRELNWISLVDWSKLPSIRSDLDQLPEPTSRDFPQARDDSSQNVFRREEKTWNLSHKSKSISIPHRVGLFYISILLGHPKRPFTPTDLRRMHTAWTAETSRPVRERAHASTLNKFDLSEAEVDYGEALDSPGTDLGDRLDEKGRVGLQRRLDELPDEIKSERARGNEAQAESLEKDLRELQETLDKSRGLAGRSRKISEASRKDRNTVRIGIIRALEALQSSHAPLYQHLRRSLVFRSSFLYAPETSVDWSM